MAALSQPLSSVCSAAPDGELTLATTPLADLLDRDVLRRLCGDKLFVRFSPARSEIACVAPPKPLVRLVLRRTYLPFLHEEVLEAFKAYLPPAMGQPYNIWFEYRGTPLKWNEPFGVSIDKLCGSEVPYPVEITVHFLGEAPSKEVLPYAGMDDLKKAVLSDLRQAIFIQHGDNRAWAKMRMEQQQGLWNAIQALDLDAYAEVKQAIACQNLSKVKKLPIRLHIGDCSSGDPTTYSMQALRYPISPLRGGEPVTVLDFLQEVMPALLGPGCNGKEFALKSGVELLVYGLSIPLETPLHWLALHAPCLDSFVHMVVRLA